MKKPKVEFTKNKNGEIIGAKINEQLSEQEFIKHFIKPEINQALQQQRKEIVEKIEEMGKPINTHQELKRADVLIEVIKKIKTLTK